MSLSVVMPIGIYSAQTGMVQAQRTFEKAAESIASGSLRSSQKALENAQTGYNFTSVADNALGSVTQNLQRIRELSIQAANGVYSDSQRAAMQAEIDMNVEQIKQTLNQAEFNGKPTINAVTPENPEAASVVDFMVNPDNSSVITYDPNITLDSMNFDVSSSQAAAANLDSIDSMLNDINAKRGEIGAVQTAFEGAINQQNTNIISNSASLSSIRDTDYAQAITDLKKAQFSMELMAKVMKTMMETDRYVLNLLQWKLTDTC